MDGSTFRTAETTSDPLAHLPDAPRTPSPILSVEEKKGGLYVYESLHGHPYTAEHFGIKLDWDSPTSEAQDKIKSVDDWVQAKAKERNLTDSSSSYDEVVDGILKQIGKSKNESKRSQFERVSHAIEAYKRLEMAKLPTILDVKSMTPDEYKKTRA